MNGLDVWGSDPQWSFDAWFNPLNGGSDNREGWNWKTFFFGLNEYQKLFRAQEVRATEIDKVELYKCFRPGDIVKAEVVKRSWLVFLNVGKIMFGQFMLDFIGRFKIILSFNSQKWIRSNLCQKCCRSNNDSNQLGHNAMSKNKNERVSKSSQNCLNLLKYISKIIHIF